MNNRRFVLNRTFKWVAILFQISAFGFVLFFHYGPQIFSARDSVGYNVTMLLYVILYITLCNVFHAFKSMEYPVTETILSQVLSFGIADFLLYCEFCAIRHNFVDLGAGFITAAVQAVFVFIWAIAFKQVTIRTIQPESILVLTGSRRGMDTFIKKMKRRRRTYRIERVMDIDALGKDWKKELEPYQGVIFYEVNSERRSRFLWDLIGMRKSIFITPSVEEITLEGFGPRHLIDTPMLKYEYRCERFWYNFFKRLMDIVLSLFVLILFSPVLIITAIAIKAEDHGPVFFRQDRCTKGGRVFSILKFRSMVVDAEKEGRTVPYFQNDPRVTRVGRIIRMLRIDEFPQLLNVLKGEMSLVGPRPERVEHVREYTKEVPEFVHRLRVKGGLTGYAQLYGKYNTSAYDKLRLDLQYIERQSVLLDIRLLLLTIKIMFVPESSEGFTAEASAAITRKDN